MAAEICKSEKTFTYFTIEHRKHEKYQLKMSGQVHVYLSASRLLLTSVCKHLDRRRPAAVPLGEECCPVIVCWTLAVQSRPERLKKMGKLQF